MLVCVGRRERSDRAMSILHGCKASEGASGALNTRFPNEKVGHMCNRFSDLVVFETITAYKSRVGQRWL